MLIFAEKKADVDDIHEYLLLKGVGAVAIHGDKGDCHCKLKRRKLENIRHRQSLSQAPHSLTIREPLERDVLWRHFEEMRGGWGADGCFVFLIKNKQVHNSLCGPYTILEMFVCLLSKYYQISKITLVSLTEVYQVWDALIYMRYD